MANCTKTKVFDRLRPICVQLTKEHTRENLAALSKSLLSVDRLYMQELQEYVLFPLRIILKQDKKYSEELYTDIYVVMEKIISQTRVSSWDMFQDLFNSGCITLGSPEKPGKVSLVSEEMKMAIIQTLKALVKNSDYSIIQNLFSVWNLPSLGHAVSVLLNVADQERSRPLKIVAMECILELCLEDKKYCSRVKAMLGDTFSSFLPGISITLCQIITGDLKQGHNVIKTALHLLTWVTRLVLDDKLLQESRAKHTANKQGDNIDPRLQNLAVNRTEEWVETTASKLKVIIKTVSKVKVHSSWKVRLGLIEMASVLLHHCTGSLKNCIPELLELLVGMLGDEYPVVASQSRHDLEAFSRSYVGKDCKPLVEILEENLHSLTTSLPRQIRAVDEEQKLATVHLLYGYLSLLGPNMNSMFMCAGHLQRLGMSLVQVLELDCSDIKIVEERTTLTGHGSSAIEPDPVQDIVKPKKYFKHFQDNKIFQELQNVCRLIGYYGNLHIVIDYFLGVFQESSLYRLQSTLIINEIILGVLGGGDLKEHKRRQDSQDDLESIVRILIEEYLSPLHFQLITSASHSDVNPERRLQAILSQDSTNSVNVFNRNILQICLFLEGLGNFAKVLEESYVPFLMQTMYPLLEKLGDETSFISSFAYLSLVDTCKACKYRSIDALIRENADYLVNAISLRLRHFHDNQRSPLVLKVMLQYSGADILPLVEDTIQEILLSLDDHYGDQAQLFMGVLSELTKAVNRWFPTHQKLSEDGVEENNQTKSSTIVEGDLCSYFNDYLKQKRIASGDVLEDDVADVKMDDTGEEEIDDSDEKKEIPLHISVVKQIMTRCKHLLSSNNPRLQLVVLDTVGHACYALCLHQNELLPLIHEIWPAFSLRFSDEKLVTRKALEVLRTIAEVSGDFTRKRFVKDVVPKLAGFLDKQAQISVHTGQSYLYTVNYKLQYSILSQLGFICNKLGIQGNDHDRLSSSCVIYLSARQPKQLQQVAMDTCREFIKMEPDGMWLKLCDLYCQTKYNPPSDCFEPVKFKSQVGVRSEYTDNVSKLLSELSEKQ